MPARLVDLSGRTCLVTGATSGVGRAAAARLARLGAHVVVAVRDRERGSAVARDIQTEGRGGVSVKTVDLASQGSIRSFAREFIGGNPTLDVLVNNAGIWSEERRTGPDGIELVWATNVLGGFLLTELLLASLMAAPGARIINVASRQAEGLDLADVEFVRRPYAGARAYAQSKQANRLWTWALARRLEGTRVTANAMSPGTVATPLLRKGGWAPGLLTSIRRRLRARSPGRGADTIVWLSASPEVEERNGRFYVDRREHQCHLRDTETEEALWELCRQMTS